ncbi:hypothetical protein CF15_00605 [Pyrodictium occultum]|uniref:Uncharacterized protein n=1 Tax=Pyrodictium occultum TaxID=2309 RepID=A0A0V8RTJ5_PYROC|nr:hypothetical protein CF15_00605 [Pyrodictium occultum]
MIIFTLHGSALRLKAHYHPKGCMRARQSHVDLPCSIEPLCSLAAKRGMKLACRSLEGCITVMEPVTGIEARLCSQSGSLACSRQVYVMRTRGGSLYIGPVVYNGG